MALMDRRQDPAKESSLEEKEAQLQAVAGWLGLKWLERKDPHPVRDLWNRRDWLATLELLTIGHGLLKFKDVGFEKNLKEAAEDVRSNDFGNRNGSLLEVLGAAMCNHASHPVTFPRVGQPGFDFNVNLPNQKKLRMSCKALIPSAKELEFRKFAQELQNDFVAELLVGTASITRLILLNPNDPKVFDKNFILEHLKEAGRQGFTPEGKAYQCAGWAIRIDELVPEGDDKFWPKEASYTFLMLSPFLGNEQRRFESKIKDAVENLKKHCSDISQDVGNLILVKIPAAVSISAAKEWLSHFWSDDSRIVSGVCIVRTQVVSNPGPSRQSQVIYECVLEENPRSTYSIKSYFPSGFGLTLEVPIGAVATEESKIELHIGENVTDIKNMYVHISGHHFYHSHFDGKSSEFTAVKFPGISVSNFLTGIGGEEAIRMDFLFPKDEELVLI